MSSIHQALLMIGDEIRYWLSQRYPVAQPPEAYRANISVPKVWLIQDVREAYTTGLEARDSTLVSIQKFYTWPREAYTAGIEARDSTLVTIQKFYDWPRERYTADIQVRDSTLVVIQLFYNNWPRERYTAGISIISGTLA